MNLYMMSMTAQFSGGCAANAGVVLAADEDEAYTAAMMEAIKQFPRQQGYHEHKVVVDMLLNDHTRMIFTHTGGKRYSLRLTSFDAEKEDERL